MEYELYKKIYLEFFGFEYGSDENTGSFSFCVKI